MLYTIRIVDLSPGRYRYIVERDDEPLESVSFDAV